MTIPGQEILTKDNISIKLSISMSYEIADAHKAHTSAQYYVTEFYNVAQMQLCDIVAELTLDELFENKKAIDGQLFTALQPIAETLGLKLAIIAIRDIILPANLKRAYAGVLEAQKEAQKQLEKARDEQAVLRSLANSSKMNDNNPSILQARIVQALADGKNTIVYSADGNNIVPPAAEKG